jgi:hypothetical protein
MKRFSLAVFSALCVASALRAQTVGQLYLVTGLATPKDNFTVPSVVYSVDRSKQITTPVVELVGPRDGSIFVQADHERRLIVIGSSHSAATRLVVLSMDSPSQPRSNLASYEGWFENFLFQNEEGRLIEAFHIGPCCTQDRLIGFDLLTADPNSSRKDLPWGRGPLRP